jgi:hypothetical protein
VAEPLAVLPPGAKVAISFDIAEVRKSLSVFSTRLEGERYVKALKLRKPDLVSLATALGVEPASKDNIDTLVNKIVCGTVGGRADAVAMHHTS